MVILKTKTKENKKGAEFQVTSAYTPVLPAHFTD